MAIITGHFNVEKPATKANIYEDVRKQKRK